MIIYPPNIDSALSKKQGRKIAKKHAVPNPKVKEMLKALQVLSEGDVRLEVEASYPRNPWDREGRVVCERKEGKHLLMKNVAKEIKRMRTLS
jgi:signal recognition particle subunit SRP19